MSLISYLVEKPAYAGDIPQEQFHGHTRLTKEAIGDIYEDAKPDLARHEDLKRFLDTALDELGHNEGNLITRLNSFIREHSQSAALLRSEADFGAGHLAAIYAALKDEGHLEAGRGRDKLEREWDLAKKELKILDGKAAVVLDKARGGLRGLRDRATDAAGGLSGRFGRGAGAQKASDAVEALGDNKIQAAASGRNMKIFVHKAIAGILGEDIPAGSESALVGKLNEFLGGEYFDAVESLNDLTAQQLSVIIERASEAGLFDPKNESNLLNDWDNLREELGLPEGLELAQAEQATETVLAHAPAANPPSLG